MGFVLLNAQMAIALKHGEKKEQKDIDNCRDCCYNTGRCDDCIFEGSEECANGM